MEKSINDQSTLSEASTSAQRLPVDKNSAATHPRVRQMVFEAIDQLRDPQGSYYQDIKRFIKSNYNLADFEALSPSIRKELVKSVKDGRVIQVKTAAIPSRYRLSVVVARNMAKESQSNSSTDDQSEEESSEPKMCNFCNKLKPEIHFISSGIDVKVGQNLANFSDQVLPKFFPRHKICDQICKQCVEFITRFAMFRNAMMQKLNQNLRQEKLDNTRTDELQPTTSKQSQTSSLSSNSEQPIPMIPIDSIKQEKEEMTEISPEIARLLDDFIKRGGLEEK